MPMWRCPHCATPQAEASRCWVCKRSSTSCRTCRNFRRAVAGSLGYCALDRRRIPLRGDELRGCWEAPPPAPEDRPAAGDSDPVAGARRHHGFVPIEPEDDVRARVAPAPPWQPPPDGSLWAEVD